MILTVYKGFNKDFLENLKDEPLIKNNIDFKFNVFNYDLSYKKKLKNSLLLMDEQENKWVIYEEFTYIKDLIDIQIKDGLEVNIIINNIYPNYFPLYISIDDNLLDEILKTQEAILKENLTINCEKFLSIYSTITRINNNFYVNYYNFENDLDIKYNIHNYYPATLKVDVNSSKGDYNLFINNDIESYLRNFEQIKINKPKIISYKKTDDLVSNKIEMSLIAYCQFKRIILIKFDENIVKNDDITREFKSIAENELGIKNFEFREISFYRNPILSNDIIKISQGQIIKEIVQQAENSYESENSNFRDIFITASTGAGKSIMFQIPAIYLGKKYNKLTIVIEPVKALMEDQKSQLNARGFNRVEMFNSDLISQIEKENVLKKVKNGEVDILYLSPETLLSYSIESLIGDREIGLLIVDEAHIVTTWGIGFRPDYWYLGSYINTIRNRILSGHHKEQKIQRFPICAFTATAIKGGPDDSVNDTIISLYMENPIEYLGYVKRDNIIFNINIESINKINNTNYLAKKSNDLSIRVEQWARHGKKTIVYFPYAKTAHNAYNSVREFSQVYCNHDRIGLYTGQNTEDYNANFLIDYKKEVFEKFRTGEYSVIYATKAFGMGVDVDDIENVYHYAISGNLCDYVQEIGRAARKPGSKGYAILDYYNNDNQYMKKLFGMSQIMQYQIIKVLSKIYDIYRSKNCARSFLIPPESFTYIFNVKGNDKQSENICINKLKTCLLMLEKDFYDKYSFKVIVTRPQGIFTKAYVCVTKQFEDIVLNSKYKDYFNLVHNGRFKEMDSSGEPISDFGDIYSIDLKGIWEKFYQNLSFPKFKHYFYTIKNLVNDIYLMPEIKDYISLRQKIKIETKNNILLSELKEKIIDDIKYITDVLYSNFKKTFFTLGDFANVIKKRYGISKAKVIANSIFDLVDPNHRVVKIRNYDDVEGLSYSLANGTFKSYMEKSIVSSSLMDKLNKNNNTKYENYLRIKPMDDNRTDWDNIVLKMLSIFDYISYEITGGEQPEIFIRLNDPEKIRRIVFGEVKYSNNYVTKAKQKHDRDEFVLKKFIEDLSTNEERWDYIEKYFLGKDVLEGKEIIDDKKISLVSAIRQDKSYNTDQLSDWNAIVDEEFFEEKYIPLIEKLSELGCPKPEFIDTIFKKNMVRSHVRMSWPKKNVLIFHEDADESDLLYCAKKGWIAYKIDDINPQELVSKLKEN